MRKANRAERGGFTLLELLVVVAVISILAAGLSFAVVGVLAKAKSDRTESSIGQLMNAINNYKSAFGAPPPVYSTTAVSSTEAIASNDDQIVDPGTITFGTGDLSSTNDRFRRNRAVRVYLECRWEGQKEAFIGSHVEISRADVDNDGIREYVDAWGLALVFNCPGGNHIQDVDLDGNPVDGAVDTSDPYAGRSTTNPARWTFDIFSFGPDNVEGDPPSSNNSPQYPNHEHEDDITSWHNN